MHVNDVNDFQILVIHKIILTSLFFYPNCPYVECPHLAVSACFKALQLTMSIVLNHASTKCSYVNHKTNVFSASQDTIPCREQDNLEFIINRELTRSNINMILDSLTAREKMVVVARYGLDDGRAKILHEVGDMMGISYELVRQIELCAFQKMKSKKRMIIKTDYSKAYSS
jgi:Sigma-70, region 4